MLEGSEKDGVFYTPFYANPLFDRGDEVPNVYCQRPQFAYAYPTTLPFSDVDTSITFGQRVSSSGACGDVFRALDSVQLYSVDSHRYE